METGESGTQRAKTHDEARKLLDEAWDRATKAYKETKEQIDAVHKEARKFAVDREASKRADDARNEALTAAKTVRDSITNVALAAFTDFWRQQDIDAQAALAEAKARSDAAHKVYQAASEQADTLHKEAKRTAVDGAARKQADQEHKEAVNRAKKARDETVGK
jgi:hypothetical protein